MYAKLFAFVVFIKLLCILTNAFDKIKYTTKPGHKMTSVDKDTLIVANKIQCVRACKMSPICTSFNFQNNSFMQRLIWLIMIE